MFRAVLLSIVMMLAAGPDAGLLCGVWCHSGGGMDGACEHQTVATAPSVVANEGCIVGDAPVLFVREDGRRGVSAPDAAGAVAVPRFVSAPAADIPSVDEPDGRRLLALRPLVLALRI